ncbi:hypothetical protein GJAV_G00006890 [Gymnothorax javanicus]|nr:hypothetical protein GJAV_G00006890 [Gymnothorax javanicus]
MERNQPTAMVWCEKGIQILLATVGAFAAFGLMTVAIGTDYWLYARAFICNSTANRTHDDPHNKDRKDPGALTHSGLWRICCLEDTAIDSSEQTAVHLFPFICLMTPFPTFIQSTLPMLSSYSICLSAVRLHDLTGGYNMAVRYFHLEKATAYKTRASTGNRVSR